MRALAVALALAGCTGSDLCDGHDGPCVGVVLEGDATIDQLRITIGSALPLVTPPAPKVVALPIQTAIFFSPGPSGRTFDVAFVGLFQGASAATGSVANLPVDPPLHQDIVVSLEAPPAARHVFLLPPAPGDLAALPGGPDGACGAAAAGVLPGSYRALLGVRAMSGSPLPPLPGGGRAVVTPSGVQVATDDTFFTAVHLAPIDEDANGKTDTTSSCVWTNFGADSIQGGADCNGWGTMGQGGSGATGSSASYLDGSWASASTGDCLTDRCHVYCLEQ